MTTAATWQAQTTSPQRTRLGRFGSNWSFGRPSSSSQPRTRAQTISSHVPQQETRRTTDYDGAADWSGNAHSRRLDKGKGREIFNDGPTQTNNAESASWDSLMDEAQMSDPFRNSRGSARGAHVQVQDESSQSHNQSGSTSGHGHSDSYSGHPYGTAGAYTTSSNADASDDRGRPRSRAYSASAGAMLTVPGRPQASQSFVSEQSKQHPFASASAVSGQSGRDRGGDTIRAGARQPQPHSGKQTVIHYASPDLNGVGIGESPVPAHRGHQHARSQDSDHGFRLFAHGHQHQQKPAAAPPPQVAPTPRGSFSSFWTFGHASHSKGPGVSTGRLSGESSSQSQSRPSTSAAAQYGSPSVVPPALHAPSTSSMRPRANTTMEMLPAHASSELLSPVSHTTPLRRRSEYSNGNFLAPSDPYEKLRGNARDEVDFDEPEDVEVSYPSHPYAMALPNKGHREFSTLLPADKARQRGKSKERRVPILNFTIPSKHSINNLRSAASRGFLKSSVSTPNLRSADHRSQGTGGSEKQGSSPNSPGFGPKWLSAETWCDALIFPRPRFRVRAAHVISPPESPVLGRDEKPAHNEALYRLNGGPSYNSPPYSAPVTTITRSDELYDNELDRRGERGLVIPPSSAPPLSALASGSAVEAKKVGENSKSNLEGKSVPTRPPRPKSFALDDLALPSPAPSLLRVLKEREEFTKERDDWKVKASKSFQNKRSRSLSRSRAKAMEKRGRKISADEDELKTSFAFIAASAFLGHQTMRPSVSEPAQSSAVSKATNSVGLNTISTHSRKSSGTSNAHITGYSSTKGHGRKESWGKTALKATTGLCTFGTDISPVEEKSPNSAAQARDHSKYTVLEDGRPSESDAQREAGRNGVLLIAPYPKPPPQYAPQNRVNDQLSPSPVPSSAESTSRSGVGIAVSTPTALLPLGREEAFQFGSHPFASNYNEELPHPSDYAGPHPSSARAPAFNVEDMRDINTRHRRQPSGGAAYTAPTPISHPYASANESRPRPTLRLPAAGGGLTVPVTTMFAQVGNGEIREVLPDEIQYSPYSQNPSSRNSSRNSDALGVEEALSVAFSRTGVSDRDRSSGDETKDVFPVIEDDEEDDDDSNYQRDENDTVMSVAAAQIVTGMSAIKSPVELRHAVMPRVDEGEPFMGPTSEANESGWRTSVNGDIVRHGSNASHRSPFYAPIFKQESSSPGLSLDSSPMASPRQISSMEEEDYQDLFYRPGMQSAGNSIRRTPSSELVKSLSSRTPSGGDPPKVFTRPPIAKTASTGSALTNLSRQLSEFSSQLDDERQTFGVLNDSPRSNHFIDVEEREDDILPMGDDDELVFETGLNTSVSMNISGIRHASTDPSLIIPEDVESDSDMSVNGHGETVEGAEIVYRLGEVSTLATPNPVQDGIEHRFSTHGSYFEHEERRDDDFDGQQNKSAHHSLQPPLSAAVTDNTRSSYVTSLSSASRISQLSDFPVPPTHAQDVVSPGQIIQSYFNPTPTTQKEDPMDARSSYYHDGSTVADHGEPTVDGHDEPTVTIPAIPRTRNRSTTFGVEEVPNLDLLLS